MEIPVILHAFRGTLAVKAAIQFDTRLTDGQTIFCDDVPVVLDPNGWATFTSVPSQTWFDGKTRRVDILFVDIPNTQKVTSNRTHCMITQPPFPKPSSLQTHFYGDGTTRISALASSELPQQIQNSSLSPFENVSIGLTISTDVTIHGGMARHFFVNNSQNPTTTLTINTFGLEITTPDHSTFLTLALPVISKVDDSSIKLTSTIPMNTMHISSGETQTFSPKRTEGTVTVTNPNNNVSYFAWFTNANGIESDHIEAVRQDVSTTIVNSLVDGLWKSTVSGSTPSQILLGSVSLVHNGSGEWTTTNNPGEVKIPRSHTECPATTVNCDI